MGRRGREMVSYTHTCIHMCAKITHTHACTNNNHNQPQVHKSALVRDLKNMELFPEGEGFVLYIRHLKPSDPAKANLQNTWL